MMKSEETILMRAVALCFKPFLKPEEALIYTNLGRTQFNKRCHEMGIFKNAGGYFKKDDLDKICSGGMERYAELAEGIRMDKRQRRR